MIWGQTSMYCSINVQLFSALWWGHLQDFWLPSVTVRGGEWGKYPGANQGVKGKTGNVSWQAENHYPMSRKEVKHKNPKTKGESNLARSRNSVKPGNPIFTKNMKNTRIKTKDPPKEGGTRKLCRGIRNTHKEKRTKITGLHEKHTKGYTRQ